MSSDIHQHSGNKYIRTIASCVDPTKAIEVDVYAVLKAFDVRCPAPLTPANQQRCP